MSKIFDINYASGNITYIEEGLRDDLSISQQAEILREDLLQVAFEDDKFILDVGWYPEGDEEGSFVIVIVQDYKWDAPIFRSETKDLYQLRNLLIEAVKVAKGDVSSG